MKRILLGSVLLLAIGAGMVGTLTAAAANHIPNGNFEQGFKDWDTRGDWRIIHHLSPDGNHSAGISGSGSLCAHVPSGTNAVQFQFRLRSGAARVKVGMPAVALNPGSHWTWQTVRVPSSMKAGKVCFKTANANFALDNVEIR